MTELKKLSAHFGCISANPQSSSSVASCVSCCFNLWLKAPWNLLTTFVCDDVWQVSVCLLLLCKVFANSKVYKFLLKWVFDAISFTFVSLKISISFVCYKFLWKRHMFQLQKKLNSTPRRI